MTNHTLIEELLAARALGGLDDADADALAEAQAAHDPDCRECRRLEREFGEVAASLAMELEPAPLREGFEEEVLAAARATGPQRAVVDGQPRPRWMRGVAAVAAAAALVLGGFALGAALSNDEGPSAKFLAGAQIVRLQGDAPGTVAVFYRPGEPRAYIIGSQVPDAPTGDVYALWLITGETPVSAGCYTPDGGQVVGSFDEQVDQADLVAVTVESSSCPTAPTSTPILTAEISTD